MACFVEVVACEVSLSIAKEVVVVWSGSLLVTKLESKSGLVVAAFDVSAATNNGVGAAHESESKEKSLQTHDDSLPAGKQQLQQHLSLVEFVGESTINHNCFEQELPELKKMGQPLVCTRTN